MSALSELPALPLWCDFGQANYQYFFLVSYFSHLVKWKLERLLIKEEGEGGENRERRRKSLEDCMRIKYIKWFRIIIDIYLYK